MIIPIDELAPDTLHNIAREFVLREGTDYGEIEAAFADKVEQVIAKLKSGEAILVYSELHDTVDIRPVDSYQADSEE
ncbi:MAG: YheU family protein [Gammaproteobacteria bacterium]|nr:YheU family protein [Gammaproteobacteria bacterium]